MPIYRGEYDVSGDLALPNGTDKLEFRNPAGAVFVIKNGARDEQGHATGLDVTVVGPSASLEVAYKELRRLLAEQLDLLSFVTHSRFKIDRPRRVVEWEPRKRKREFRAYHTADARYPPEPELVREYLATVEVLDASNPPPFAR